MDIEVSWLMYGHPWRSWDKEVYEKSSDDFGEYLNDSCWLEPRSKSGSGDTLIMMFEAGWSVQIRM